MQDFYHKLCENNCVKQLTGALLRKLALFCKLALFLNLTVHYPNAVAPND